jgi:hypothetical protein
MSSEIYLPLVLETIYKFVMRMKTQLQHASVEKEEN